MELLQSHAPLYYQLKSYIKEKIERNEWEVGTMIPSEREIEKLFGLSRTPIRQALGELVVEGVLEKKHGKGTFVAERNVTQTTTSLIGLLESLKSKGMKPSVTVHEFRVLEAPTEVTKKLNLPERAMMIMARRQITVQERCLIVDENFFNINLKDCITEENLLKHTVFGLLEKNGIQVKNGSQSFSAAPLSQMNAGLLGMTPGSATLVIKTLLFNSRDLPLQYSVSYCNPDIYEHEIRLSR